MIKVVEGSYAVAHAVQTCRVNVVSAYPITPQTHIVEDLAKFVADGEMNPEFVNVESEHSAMSVCVGASATGARTYSATTSQGLALMFEVLFNASGMRLPIVMTAVNRAMSAPLSIWNDQQDTISARDCGWIQLYAEDVQEAHDMVIQAYKIAEDKNVLLPVMVCMDGFLLTHIFEPVNLASQEDVDAFLPPFRPELYLTTKDPKTFGAFAEPDKYMEFRYMNYEAMERAKGKIVKVAKEFSARFKRFKGGLVDEYKTEGADVIIVTMGSVIGTIKDVIDREKKVGLLKIRSYRPFPKDEVRKVLADAKNVVVLEKDISMGMEGALFTDLKATLYGSKKRPKCSGFVFGLGGRDISGKDISSIIKQVRKGKEIENKFFGLRRELL